MWTCIVTNLFIIKPARCTNFTNLFFHETLHVSDSSSVHHQEVIHCTLSNGIWHTGCRQFSSSSILVLLESCLQPVWHIPLPSVQWITSWWWTDELSGTCRVSWQNKFVKLVYLVGFITKKVTEIRVSKYQHAGGIIDRSWKTSALGRGGWGGGCLHPSVFSAILIVLSCTFTQWRTVASVSTNDTHTCCVSNRRCILNATSRGTDTCYITWYRHLQVASTVF